MAKGKKSEPLSAEQQAFIEQHRGKKSAVWMARELGVSPTLVNRYLSDRADRPPLSARKRWLFRLAALLLPLVLLGGLELGLRWADYGPNLDVFIPLQAFPDYLTVNPDLGLRYFPTSRLHPQVSIDAMARKKPFQAIRIFVLGGSSAAGYPYLYNGSFSSMLKLILARYYPERPIEVVNLAMSAVGSYTVRDLALELAPYQPDALLVYAGHNEFYGALGAGSSESLGTFRPFVLAFLKLRHWKLFQLLSDGIHFLRTRLSGGSGKDQVGRTRTLMERMVGEKEIAYGSRLYRAAHRVFERNLADVARFCNRQGIPLFVATVVSNVHDQRPFVDSFSSRTDRSAWRGKLAAARQALSRGQLEEALRQVETLLATDSLPASAWFLKGQVLEKLGRWQEAYRAYYRAKDLDALRFRAAEAINERIASLSKTFLFHLVPVKASFEAGSPHRLPGKELILEHLHPNLEGYMLMARAFARALVKSAVFGPPARDSVPDSLWAQQVGVTDVDRQVAELRIRVLTSGWPFTNAPPPSKADVPVPENDVIARLAVQFWRDEITWEQMHVKAAEYYTRSGQLEKAEREFRALIQATPMNPSPYQYLARLLLAQKKYAQAEPILHRILQLTPDPFAYKMLGSIYVNRGDVELGLPLLKRAVELAPGDPQALYNLAGALALAHQHEAALDALNQLWSIQPNFPGAARLRHQLLKHMAQIKQSGEAH